MTPHISAHNHNIGFNTEGSEDMVTEITKNRRF